MTQNTSTVPSPAAFDPLDFSYLSRLSPAGRRAIFSEFVELGDAPRVLAGLALKPFAISGSGAANRLDLHLCAQAIFFCDHAILDDVVSEVLAAHRICSSARAPEEFAMVDFGPLAALCCLASIVEDRAGNFGEAEILRTRALSFVQNLPIVGELPARDTPLYDRTSPLISAVLIEASAKGFCSSKSLDARHPLQAATALLAAGDARVAEAILSRHDFMQNASLVFKENQFYKEGQPQADRRPPLGAFEFLGSTSFWRELPAAGTHILKFIFNRLERPLDAGSVPHQILQAMILGAGEPESEGLALARSMLGDEVFTAVLNQGEVQANQAWRCAMSMAAKDRSLLPALAAVCRDVNDPQLPHFDRMRRASSYRDAMLAMVYHSSPGISEAACGSIEARTGGAAGSAHAIFSELFSLKGLPFHLARIAACARPDVVGASLSSMGLAVFASYPPADRKGLDKTPLMIFAGLSCPETFEAALDWLAAEGVLRELAGAKAWVYSADDSRKKGDLLAFCVAEGRADLAECLLKRLPDLDLKPARDVAKAMAQKSKTSAGSLALSAWESVLLGQIKPLAVHASSDEPLPPIAAPKRNRL